MPTEYDAQRALNTIRTVRQTRLREIRDRYTNAASAAAAITDPDLTPEANARRRQEGAGRARGQLAADLAQVEGETHFATLQIEAFIQQATAPAATDPAAELLAETRQQRGWDRARLLLDAGRTVGDVIAQADVDTLRALRAELPTYLAAEQVKPSGLAAQEWTEPDVSRVVRTVDQALAAKLPGNEGAALRARLDLEAVEPGLTESITALRRKVDGTDRPGGDLESAITVRIIDQRAEPAAA